MGRANGIAYGLLAGSSIGLLAGCNSTGLLAGCSSTATQTSSETHVQHDPAVTLDPSNGPAVRVRVEVAKSDAERAQGFMYRTALASDAGMIFIFEQTAVHTFWMKNTPTPLDMIFIDASFLVVGVIEGAEPFSKEQLSIGIPSRYVLEVNAGFARAHGVSAGTRVTFQDVL